MHTAQRHTSYMRTHKTHQTSAYIQRQTTLECEVPPKPSEERILGRHTMGSKAANSILLDSDENGVLFLQQEF